MKTHGVRAEHYADKPNSGGMWIDRNDDIYPTVIENNANGRISEIDRSYDDPIISKDMLWPDTLMQWSDYALCVMVQQFHRWPLLARPGRRPELLFKVFWLKPRAAL